MCRVFARIAVLLLMVLPVHAGPMDVIAELASRQALEWRRMIVDLNLVGPYYRSDTASPIWIENGRMTERAAALLDALNRAAEDGLEGSDYLPRPLARAEALEGDQDVAGFELAMSQAFLQFARDLHAGRTSPSVTDPSIVIARKPVDAAAWLASVRDAGVAETIDRLRPQHAQYNQLRRMLGGYRALAERGGWPEIASGPSLKPGMNDPRVVTLRANLKARGYGGLDADEASLYSDDLAEVIKHFQRRYGLETDGIAGPATIAALNMTAADRVRQLVVNLERWRWLPVDLGQRHVLVNQAGFEMFLVSGGETIDSRRIIVGRPFHKSPMFSDSIAYAEFNPTWTVPLSIAGSEFLPKLRKDPGYLSRNNYLLYRSWDANARPIDPYSVNWNSVSKKRFPYRIVQQPGAKNALGAVKFIFPNKFNVYLHDTPARQLFARTGRAFSHGCIRVSKPLEFARKLFGLDDTLSGGQIEQIVSAKQTRRVNLKSRIPVHLAYFTTWIDAEGLPHFYSDVYERDALVSRILFGSV